jgi:hypothetical protein
MTESTGSKSCNVCGQSFQSDRELQDHRRSQHPGDKSNEQPSGQSGERHRGDVENVA